MILSAHYYTGKKVKIAWRFPKHSSIIMESYTKLTIVFAMLCEESKIFFLNFQENMMYIYTDSLQRKLVFISCFEVLYYLIHMMIL